MKHLLSLILLASALGWLYSAPDRRDRLSSALDANAEEWTGLDGTEREGPVDNGNQKQLFVDDYIIESMTTVSRVFHSPERHPANPLIVGDQPWEQWVIEVNGRAVVYDDKVNESKEQSA